MDRLGPAVRSSAPTARGILEDRARTGEARMAATAIARAGSCSVWRQRLLATALGSVALLAAADPAAARITRIAIETREPAFGGAGFGSVGPYERLQGTAY